MSFDDWLTTPPPMESAPDLPEEDDERLWTRADEEAMFAQGDYYDEEARNSGAQPCPYCGEDDRMRCACDGVEF